MARRVVWMVMVLAIVPVVGCGDDDDDSDGPADSGTMSEKDSGPMMSMPDASNTGTAGTMSAPVAMPVPCGNKMCTVPPNPLTALTGAFGDLLGPLTAALPMPAACCFDEDAEMCGVKMNASAMCEEPADADTRCPSIDLGQLSAFAGGMGFGCCTEQGLCGVDGSTFGRGCVENGEARGMLEAAGIGMFLMVPAAQSCEGDDLDDAGAELDAGH